MEAYLDHAATTPLRPESLAAMVPYLTEHYGNPSGSHSRARRARMAIDEARDEVARCLGCEPGEVVFTSGGTESDNLAVLGAPGSASGSGTGSGTGSGPTTAVCSAVEHHAVLNAVAARGGITVRVDRAGVVDLDALAEVLSPDVALVSVMLVNNEVGSVQPLAEVAALVRERAPGGLLHTDAVAAVGWLDVAGLGAVADLVSVSGHKFGGPKGVGALVVRNGTTLAPVIHGGAQERGRRPGTHDVAGLVGMAAALKVATDSRDETVARIGALRDRLTEGLTTSIANVGESAPCAGVGEVDDGGVVKRVKIASSCHLRVDGVDQEELLMLLDDEGVCASAGAACASGAIEPSHVLLAMGLSPVEARSGIRFSLGYTTTGDEIDHVLEVMPKVVERLRA
ncbi:MAG TPA: cysteine desulfurase family protein [Acidimicrobiales bacterium]|nr:cysteine desulfurase family protein [Acidimicrobiales bacterium]